MFSEYLQRKDNIIIAAIDILDELGMQGMTTKEIARRQKITEPAIYRQFSGKKEIIQTIIERFQEFDQSVFNTISEQKLETEKGLEFFLNTYAEYFQNYPQISTLMLSFDTFRFDPEIDSLMKERHLARKEILKKLLSQTNVSAEEGAEIILGILWSATYNWRLANESYVLKDKLGKMYKIVANTWFTNPLEGRSV
jgi:AcrR family transcriptional regulator